MLLYLISRIISSAAAFLYPTYASYKTLSRRPALEADLERWLMYWAVLGTIVGLEYVAEWSISWIPFYHPLKTLFLLYLALPQTRGASYVYTRHLYPLLAAHEAEIDVTLVRVKEAVWRWVQERIKGAWEYFTIRMAQEGNAAAREASGASTAILPSSPSPTSTSSVSSSPAQLVQLFWRTYGPAVLASGAALLQSSPVLTAPEPVISPKRPNPTETSTQASSSLLLDMPRPSLVPSALPSSLIPSLSPSHLRPPQGTNGMTSAIDLHMQHDLLARRRALEAELAALPLPNPQDDLIPGSQRQSTYDLRSGEPAPRTFSTPQRVASSMSSTYLPESSSDERGLYEEIKRDEVEGSEDDSVVLGHLTGGEEARWWRWSWGGRAGEGRERMKTE